MTTFYTDNLYKGEEESLRSFVLRCALNSSAGWRASECGEKTLPIDKAPILSTTSHYKDKLKEAKQWLVYYEKAKENKVNLLAVYNEFVKNTKEKDKKNKERIDAIKARYLAMKNGVEGIEMPPEYSDFKLFMLKQLDDSINFDCVYHETVIPPIDVWIEGQIEHYQWEVDCYTKEVDDEEKRVEKDNAFLSNLYTILDKIDSCDNNKSQTDTDEN